MRVAFFFDGTGASGDQERYIENNMEMSDTFSDDTIRVYIKGCQHKNVGGGVISPNLNIASQNIVNSFDDKGRLDFAALRGSFGSAIVSIIPDTGGVSKKPESILLSGFSRGAVTGILTAKELYKNDSTKNIPVHIVANQPVPGKHINNEGSTLNNTLDCSECTNIESADIILGSYDYNNGLLQNYFFYQMTPTFNQNTKSTYKEIPITAHLQSFFLPFLHVADSIQKIGSYTILDNEKNYASNIKNFYGTTKNIKFTAPSKKQFVFGDGRLDIIKDKYYFQMYKEELAKHLSPEALEEVFNSERMKICLINIFKTANNVIESLISDIPDGSQKEESINNHKTIYISSIIDSSYKYLRGDVTNREHNNNISLAESEFGNNALDIDRNPHKRVAMQVLSGVIFGISTLGIGFLISGIVNRNKETHFANKICPFFSSTNSSKKISGLTETISSDYDGYMKKTLMTH